MLAAQAVQDEKHRREASAENIHEKLTTVLVLTVISRDG